MQTMNISNARNELYKIASSCIKYNDIVNVTTKEGDIVIMSRDDYNDLIESLYLASIPGLYESIEEGVKTPLEECVKVKWK